MIDNGVLVLGIGAMGSAALYHLARRDAAPAGIDQYAIDHPHGSSHGRSRAFRMLYHDATYIELAKAALPLWKELEAHAGEHLFIQSGFLAFGHAENDDLNRNIGVLKDAGVARDLLSADAVAERFPALRLPPEAVACYTPDAGYLDASRCVRTHVSLARDAGATVHTNVRVRAIDLTGEYPILETSAGTHRCERLVVTAGPWAASLLQERALPLQVTRQQTFYFQPRNPDRYQPEFLPVYADYDNLYYGFPAYGPGLKVADDSLGETVSPDSVDRTLNTDTRNRLGEWVATILPDAGLSFVEGATCMYTVTPDRDFIIGRHPDNPNVIIGAGFSGHGFKFATLIGKILADLALDGDTDYSIERFRPERFQRTVP